MNVDFSTNFSIQLVTSDDTLSSALQLQDFTDLSGPVGGPLATHQILQTARIPLSNFNASDLASVRGIRVTFDSTTTGAIFLTNIRVSAANKKFVASPFLSVPRHNLFSVPDEAVNPAITAGNRVRDLRAASVVVDGRRTPIVEVQLESEIAFPTQDELPTLTIGGTNTQLSRYPDDGDTHTLIFTLPLDEFAKTREGDSMRVQYGRGRVADQWDFGALTKPAL
ncbi:MAG: hypothetical protein NVS3B20_20050 [Polyangiales bacterium]